MEVKDRLNYTHFFRWIVASKARTLGAAGNAPDSVTKFEKIPGGIFELNETQTNHESLEHKNKLMLTEKLAGLSLQNRACRFGLKISSRKIHPATGVTQCRTTAHFLENPQLSCFTSKFSLFNLKMNDRPDVLSFFLPWVLKTQPLRTQETVPD